MAEKSKKNQLQAIVEQTLQDTPFEVVVVEFAKTGAEWTLRVYIDHPEGITLDHCQNVTHLLLDALEREDPVSLEYHIEVSSPGVDRPLVREEDYRRFLGERVFVKTHQAVDGRKKFTGALTGFENGVIAVQNEDDRKDYRIPIDQIAKATLKPILNFT